MADHVTRSVRILIFFFFLCETSQGSAGYDDHRPLRHSECRTMSGRLVTNLGRRPASASAVAASRRRLVRSFHFPAFLLHGIERRYLCPAFAQHSPQCTQQAGILSAGHGSDLQSSGQIRFRRPVSRAPFCRPFDPPWRFIHFLPVHHIPMH